MSLKNSFYNTTFIDDSKNLIRIEYSMVGSDGRINVLMNKNIGVFSRTCELLVYTFIIRQKAIRPISVPGGIMRSIFKIAGIPKKQSASFEHNRVQS